MRSGSQKLHRSGKTIRNSTRYKKFEDKDTWYAKKTKDQYVSSKLRSWGNKQLPKKPSNSQKPADAPIFIPRTPDGRLAEELRKVEKDLNLTSRRKIKVVA